MNVVPLLLVSLSPFACAPRAQPLPSVKADSDVVSWSNRLKDDGPALLDAFELKAQAHGCRTLPKQDAVVVLCREGSIVMMKEHRIVTIGCKGLTLAACHQLFAHIVDTP
ncbi:MAG: hypothetical protein NVSMB1_03520 [Polyangiales bacterium]